MHLLALLLTLVGVSKDSPEFYFEQTTYNYEDGQARGPGMLSRVWFSGRKMRLEAGSKPSPVLILRLDQGRALRLDPVEKVAISISLEDLRSRAQLDLSAAGEAIGGTEDGSARTRALDETRVVAGQSCQGFRIRSRTGAMDVYVAKGVGIGVDAFADFLEWSGANQALGGIIAELRRLPGFPMEIHSHVSTMGHREDSVSTVTLLRVEPADAALFEIPKDYTVTAEPREQ